MNESNMHKFISEKEDNFDDSRNEDKMVKSRQLETVAFPVGIAIGAIGAALWPTFFPGKANVTTTTTTTTTTPTSTTTTQRSNDNDDYGDFFIVENDLQSTITTTSTTNTMTTSTS